MRSVSTSVRAEGYVRRHHRPGTSRSLQRPPEVVEGKVGALPSRKAQWKLSPQAQEPVALGLSMVKPCFSMVSTKSMVAPIR